MPVTWYNNYVCADLRPEDHYMANKYNAFISYRHAPEDIKIASEVQRSLERFKIPPAIQQKTGIKRFERIFRDKEELPITADLNDDIDEAIKNSDNLIVICSTRTSESIWVRKEIETFLKYHTKKEIFTVLVDGEPEDVIPDILQRDTITIKKADGTTETKEALIEPLSCDYRIGIKKARKVELPRLAASLLKCSYDELVQRRRQYERRRNAMIGTVSACAGLCIMAYLTWSLMQIRMNYDLAQANYQLAQDNYQLAQANLEAAQSNYREALRNQSEYLATVSGQHLKNGDRVSAILLALAALPSEGNDRPVTTRAEHALTSALSCYLTPGAFGMEPVWRYSTSYRIEKYIVTQDASQIIALDASGDITIWNIDDHTVCKVIPRQKAKTNDFAVNREGILVINYDDKLIAYDNTYENVLWTKELSSDYTGSSTQGTLFMISEGEEVLYKGLSRALILDTLSGTVNDEFTVRSGEYDEYSIYLPTIGSVAASKDGRLLAVVSSVFKQGSDVSVYDRDTSEWISLSGKFSSVMSMRFSPDNELVISYEKEDTDNMNFQMGIAEYLTSNVRTVSRFDIESGKEVWGIDIPYTVSASTTKIHFCDYGESEEAIPSVCVAFSNKLYVFDIESGKVLSANELLGEHVSSYVSGNSTGLVIVLKNGDYVYASLSSGDLYMVSYSFFQNGVSDSAAFYSEEEQDNHILIKYAGDNGIIEYDNEYYDTGFHGIEGVEEGEAILSGLMCGDKVLFFGDAMNLYCYDPSSDSIVWKTPVEGEFYTSVKLVCYAPDDKAYLINRNSVSEEDRSGDKLFMVDLSDGKISRVKDVPSASSMDYCCVGDKIYMSVLGTDYLSSGIHIYDCVSHTVETVEIVDSENMHFGTGKMAVSPDGKKAIFISSGINEDTSTAYVIDLESGEHTDIVCALNSFASWNPDSDIYAIGCDNYVNLYSINDGLFQTIPRGDSGIVSMVFCDKGLITYSQISTLTLYDLEGEMIGNVQAEGENNVTYDRVNFSFAEDELIVTNGAYSSLIDLNEFEVRTELYGLMCYDHENGRFFEKVFAELPGVTNVVYYDRLSIDELIERGNEYVGSETLSEEMKNLYGIS